MHVYQNFSELVRTWEGDPSPVLIYGDTRESLTRDALAKEIFREEAVIRSQGPGNEFIVTDHTPRTIIRIFASVMAGHDVVLADEGMTDESLMALIRLVRPTGICASDEELADLLSRTAASCSQETGSAGLSLLPALAPWEEGRLIFFTSGTTAMSRAVVLTSRSLMASSWSGQSMLPCGPGDTLLSILPLSHVFGFVCSLLWGLSYGAAIALGRGVRHMLDDCMHFKPTILSAVPSVAQLLMMRGSLNSELRTLLVGAAPLPEASVRMLRQMGIQVYLGYGLTETSSGIAITQDLDNPYALYPCPGADIRIEPDGEISVATPCLMEGYYDFGAEGGLTPVEGGRFYTGDLGVMDKQGALHLTGRKKDILVLPDGTKIFCPEYEAELADLLGTADLALILKNNRPVLAIGQTHPAARNRLLALIESFNRQKPRSGQIADILVTEMPLPRTATGKIKRWEILNLKD